MDWIHWLRIIDHISRSTQNIKTAKLYLLYVLACCRSHHQAKYRLNTIYCFLALGLLHGVRNKFTNDVSETAVGRY